MIVVFKKLTQSLPDSLYIRFQYFYYTKGRLNLKNPINFNQKLQWLKIHDRNPLYTIMADKYEARKYIESKIGGRYLIPLLGVWNKFDEIDFEKLPSQFVLKCTHDSGGVIICRDKKNIDIAEVKNKMNKCLKRNYFYFGREWPYKNIVPRIICEKYLVDESGVELKDYKIFCFNGEPKIIKVDFNRFENHKCNIYTIDWELIDFALEYPNEPSICIRRPDKLNDMLQIARILANNMPHLRVDFYSIKDQIYVGELTFYHLSGYGKFSPESYNDLLGSWIDLPVQDKAFSQQTT